ncbi:MAG: AMP-binding enzyme, partial [Hyphomonas sp.]
AAVVGIAHPKWEERPLLVLELYPEAKVAAADVLSHMAAQIAKWQLPDEIVFDTVPLTATGKIDKKTLRVKYADRYG